MTSIEFFLSLQIAVAGDIDEHVMFIRPCVLKKMFCNIDTWTSEAKSMESGASSDWSAPPFSSAGLMV
jgi:hypothetical protein